MSQAFEHLGKKHADQVVIIGHEDAKRVQGVSSMLPSSFTMVWTRSRNADFPRFIVSRTAPATDQRRISCRTARHAGIAW